MNEAVEKWLPVVGYEGLYSVSDLGRVRSEARVILRKDGRQQRILERIKKSPVDGRGYPRVALYRPDHPNGETLLVHRLVMEAFVGPCGDGLEVCHNNNIPTDPRLVNLRYGTRSENLLDKRIHGTHNNSNKTHCPQGHAYDAVNTYYDRKRNARHCKACKSAREAARRMRQSN